MAGVSVASASCPGPNLAKTDCRVSTLIRGPGAGLTSLKGTDHPSEQSPRQCGPALAAGKEPPRVGPRALRQSFTKEPLTHCCPVSRPEVGRVKGPLCPHSSPPKGRGFFLTSHPTFNNCPTWKVLEPGYG